MFRRLLTLDQARKIIDDVGFAALGIEEVSLIETHNRILAQDLVSSFDIPPFDRSTVDGYAVRAEDTFGAEENVPVTLSLVDTINVGEPANVRISKGETAEIVTGAQVPDGADAVVMMEDTERRNESIIVYSAAAKNENIMRKGTDIRKGEMVLQKGQILGSREIGAVAALGREKIKTFVVPKVAVLSTGNEVTEPGNDLPPGKIYDINAYSLAGALIECGAKPIYMGIAPDDKEKLRAALEKAVSISDVVVTSAGVSVGPKDMLPQTIDGLGEPGLLFSGITVKPGKPTTMGLIGKKPVFSLPGHPASALLMFHLIVQPVIRKLAGRKAVQSNTVKATAGKRMFSAKGRRTFIMVHLKKTPLNGIVAEPVEPGASGAITTLVKADGYLEIPENLQFINEDDEILVTLFGNGFS